MRRGPSSRAPLALSNACRRIVNAMASHLKTCDGLANSCDRSRAPYYYRSKDALRTIGTPGHPLSPLPPRRQPWTSGGRWPSRREDRSAPAPAQRPRRPWVPMLRIDAAVVRTVPCRTQPRPFVGGAEFCRVYADAPAQKCPEVRSQISEGVFDNIDNRRLMCFDVFAAYGKQMVGS